MAAAGTSGKAWVFPEASAGSLEIVRGSGGTVASAKVAAGGSTVATAGEVRGSGEAALKAAGRPAGDVVSRERFFKSRRSWRSFFLAARSRQLCFLSNLALRTLLSAAFALLVFRNWRGVIGSNPWSSRDLLRRRKPLELAIRSPNDAMILASLVSIATCRISNTGRYFEHERLKNILGFTVMPDV